MLFARRNKPDWREKLRIAAWPRRSWARSVAYMRKRTFRIAASPHEIALGFAFGVFISFTPLLGLHIAGAMAIAWIMGASMIASAFGTAVGNPLTFPFIWAFALGLGNWMLGRTDVLEQAKPPSKELLEGIGEQIDWYNFGAICDQISSMLAGLWAPLIKPMLVGGVPMGIIAGLICYFPVRKAVALFQQKRRESMDRKYAKAGVAAE